MNRRSLWTLACLIALGAKRLARGGAAKYPLVRDVRWDVENNVLSFQYKNKSTDSEKNLSGAIYQAYQIDFKNSIMSTGTSARGFNKKESAELTKFRNFLLKYMVDSVEWWESGKGYPLDENGDPILPEPQADPSIDRTKNIIL